MWGWNEFTYQTELLRLGHSSKQHFAFATYVEGKC